MHLSVGTYIGAEPLPSNSLKDRVDDPRGSMGSIVGLVAEALVLTWAAPIVYGVFESGVAAANVEHE